MPLFGGFAADAIGLRLSEADVRAVVADVDYLPALKGALDRFDIDPFVVVAGNNRQAAGGLPWLWEEFERIDSDGPIVATKLEDIATILFTSGTTGKP